MPLPLCQLYICIYTTIFLTDLEQTDKMESKLSMNGQFMERIHHIIDEHIDSEDFGVEQLAELAGLSRSMLHRKLIKIEGKSASDLITETRLNRAKQLLEKDIATASEVAYRVGFKSPSYFNKVFKKHYGISPGEIRKGKKIEVRHLSDELKSDNKEIKKRIALNKSHLILLFFFGMALISTLIFFLRPNRTLKSVAVLPLHNLTGVSNQDYLVDGFHDALIGELGRISSLRVISRTSTLQYRDSELSMKDIAQDLGVKFIVEGSVLQVGDSLRIIIQLIDVYPKESHVLSKDYTNEMSNILSLQSNLVNDIASNISIKLTKKEKDYLQQERKVNPETYKSYLRGMYHLNQGTVESHEKGIQYLQSAIDKDPGDAFAYAGLAVGYSLVGHGQLSGEDAFITAEVAANKAIKLDASIYESYVALSNIYLYTSFDLPKAKAAFEQALINNPNNAVAHANYAWYHILYNDMEKSIYHGRQATLIEPLSAAYSSWLALLYCHNNEFDKAEIWAQKALKQQENIPYGNLSMGWINLHRQNYDKAIEYHLKLPIKQAYWKTLLAYAYVETGNRNKAQELWNEMQRTSLHESTNPCYMGMMASCLGYSDIAFNYLNEAVETKSYPIIYLNFYPNTIPIRHDPKYQDLLRKMNLPIVQKLLTAQ